MNKKVTLYTYGMSPYGQRVFWALVYKKIPFDMVFVTPYTYKEIAFTNQIVVPVLTIGNRWMRDSTSIIKWLDEEFPDFPLCGGDEARQEVIFSINDWVSNSLIPIFFRHAIDNENLWESYKMSIKLGLSMRKTCKYAYLPMVPFWTFALRSVGFVRHHAEQVAHYGSLKEMNERSVLDLESHIGDGPFLGGQTELSIADISAYSQVFLPGTGGLTNMPDYLASQKIREWVERIESQRDPRFYQPIVPNAQEYAVYFPQ